MKVATLAVLALATVGLAAGACSGGGASPSEISVVSAITTLDNAGLHAIDELINEDQEVPADARTTALRMEAVTRLADWPEEFEDAASQLAKTLGELAVALDSDNPDLIAAGQLAKRAHDEHHDLSSEIWTWLQEKAGIGGAEDGE